MEMKQISDNCFAVLDEKNRVCDANSGLINRAGASVGGRRAEFAITSRRKVYEDVHQQTLIDNTGGLKFTESPRWRDGSILVGNTMQRKIYHWDGKTLQPLANLGDITCCV
jgi:hypothetical protein